MSRRSIITNITPLPPSISREAAVAQLHDHAAMIQLNPLVLRHVVTDPPPNAAKDEVENATWYEITDRISYLPGGACNREISYKACFYDLPNGVQTHVFAPAGVDIRSKWSVSGTLPGEPKQPVELGVVLPREGLYIREDVDLRCNMLMIGFVKRNLKKSHHVVAEKIVRQAAQKQKSSTFPVEVRSPARTFSEIETSSLPFYPPDTTPSTTPSQNHQSYPPHCACETDQHRPSCPHFRPAASGARSSARRPLSVSDLTVPPISPFSPLASITPLSPITYPELYGSPAFDQCLCTGALHSEGCALYPGLRTPLGNANSTNSPTSIQNTPASLYAALDRPNVEARLERVEARSLTPHRAVDMDNHGRLHTNAVDGDDQPNALRPMGTMQYVQELE